MRNNLNRTLQGKRKISTVHGYMLYAKILHVTMFYIAIWPNLLLVFYCIVDKVSRIDDYGEILIRIEFSQVVNQI